MLWIQTSEGDVVNSLSEVLRKKLQERDAYLMVNGISLGKIRSWDGGEYYEIPQINGVICRSKMIDLLDYKLSGLKDFFCAVEGMKEVSKVAGDRLTAAIEDYTKIRQTNPSCHVHMRRYTDTRNEKYYIIYAKEMNFTGPRIQGGKLIVGTDSKHRLDKRVFI